jgi:Domain of unknown function (DUF4265)
VTDSSKTTRQIELPAYDDSGEFKLHEVLDCFALENGRLRLVHSPGFVEGLAAGDEIALRNSKLAYEVIQRGGNLCLWFFTNTRTVEQEKQRAAPELVKNVEAMGGYLDGGTRGSLVFTIPFRAGFSAVEAVFEKAKQAHPGSVWLYGNVYDPSDGVTPLNWWLLRCPSRGLCLRRSPSRGAVCFQRHFPAAQMKRRRCMAGCFAVSSRAELSAHVLDLARLADVPR